MGTHMQALDLKTTHLHRSTQVAVVELALVELALDQSLVQESVQESAPAGLSNRQNGSIHAIRSHRCPKTIMHAHQFHHLGSSSESRWQCKGNTTSHCRNNRLHNQHHFSRSDTRQHPRCSPH